MDTIKFVEFGRGGDVAHVSRDCRCGGYGTPENPHAAKNGYGRIIPDGTLALDKRPAIATEEGFDWVFKSPMVNVDLEEEETEHCPQPNEMLANAVSGNIYGMLLAMQAVNTNEAGPLDHVSIPVYVAGWVKRGARLGIYQGGVIQWVESEEAAG